MEARGADDNTLIGSIYEAALAPDRWGDVMGSLGRILDSHIGAVVVVGAAQGGPAEIFSSADRMSSITDYQNRWVKSRPRSVPGCTLDILQAAAELPVGAIRSDSMLMCRDELERSSFYNDHLLRFDFVHAFAAKLWERPDGYGVLSLSRSRQSGAFTDDDLARYAAFHRHLQHALTMAERLSWSRIGGHDGEAAYRGAANPTLLVDRAGTCGWPNGAADMLFRREQGLRLVRGRLRTPDPAADLAFAQAVERAVRGDAAARHGGTLKIARGGDRSPLVVVVTPVGPGHDWFLPNRPHAVVTFFDADVRLAPSGERLRDLYGLTPSEAAVAQGIAKGRELTAIASDLGFTVNTARQYLTRAYAKTDTARQHDLARLLAGLATIP